jgi:hypothetical protein
VHPRILARTALAAAVGLLAACSATPDTTAAPTTPVDEVTAHGASPSASSSASPEAPPEPVHPCNLLDPVAIARLAGTQLTTFDTVSVGGQIPACQWGDGDVGVQVIQVPAEQWAKSIPDVVDQLRSSGSLDPENQSKLDAAARLLAAEDIDPGPACDLFSVMVEVEQNEPGLTTTVNYLPTKEEPEAVTAQACIDGVYSSIMLASADLNVDDATTYAATNALTTLLDSGF